MSYLHMPSTTYRTCMNTHHRNIIIDVFASFGSRFPLIQISLNSTYEVTHLHNMKLHILNE